MRRWCLAPANVESSSLVAEACVLVVGHPAAGCVKGKKDCVKGKKDAKGSCCAYLRLMMNVRASTRSARTGMTLAVEIREPPTAVLSQWCVLGVSLGFCVVGNFPASALSQESLTVGSNGRCQIVCRDRWLGPTVAVLTHQSADALSIIKVLQHGLRGDGGD